MVASHGPVCAPFHKNYAEHGEGAFLREARQNAATPLLLHINEAMWQPDGRFAVEFDLELQLFVANTRAQFLVVIEAGTAPGQGTPTPVSENLADVVWQPAPLLSQRIIISGLKLKHHFGAIVKRSLDNVISAERQLYIAWSACPANSVPQSPGFVLRARLIQFDTENSVRGAKGF